MELQPDNYAFVGGDNKGAFVDLIFMGGNDDDNVENEYWILNKLVE